MSSSFHALKASFNGGELSPLMDARVDTDKYATGCRILENMIPRPYGGVMKRPGTQFVSTAKESSTKVRMIEFKRDTDSNYMLEFGEEYIRFWNADGTPVYATSTILEVNAWVYPTSGIYAAGYIAYNSDTGLAYIALRNVTGSGLGGPAESVTEPGVGTSWPDYWNVYYVEEGVLRQHHISNALYYCIERHSPTDDFDSDISSGYWHALENEAGQYPYEIPTPFQEEELFAIQYVQLNDVAFLSHPNHFPRRLTRHSETSWLLEKVPFDFAPVLDVNETTVAVQAQWTGVADWDNATTSYAVGARVLGVTGAYDGVLFTCHTAHNASATANDEPGVGSNYTAFWNEGTSSIKYNTWATSTAYVVGQKVRRNGVIYECISNHTSAGTIDTPGLGSAWTTRWKISSADADLSGLALSLVATESTFTSDDVGSSWLLSIGTTGLVTKQALGTGSTTISATTPLFMQGGYLLRSTWASGGAPTGGSLVLEESLDNVTWSRVREWQLQDVNDGNINYEGEAPAVGAWYRISGSYTANAAADSVVLEPASSVLKLPFKITGYTSATSVSGKFVIPNDQLPPIQVIGVSTTVYQKPAFIESQGFPRAVAFHDSRIWWGGTTAQPARIWGSAIDDFYTFLTGDNDDEAIDVTLASTQANAIQWMASHNRGMVIGTTAEEWTLDSGETDSALTAGNVRLRRRTRYGSEPLAPLPITDALLWVQRGGRGIREFAYRFETDSYTAPDMTLLAEHLFRSGSIVQMAYQTTPSPIVWAVGSDGVLNGFTYDREQGITAWHRHRTGERTSGDSTVYDSFESVATIYGDNGADQVWFVVKRNIGGSDVRYIERFQVDTNAPGLLSTLATSGVNDDVCFVDSAKAGVSGTAQTGFSHLNGRTVKAAGATTSGVVATPSGTVSAGNVTLSASLPVGHWVGLPFFSRLRPMKLEIPLQNGTAQARKWRLTRIALNLVASCGGTVSTSINRTPFPIEYQGKAQPFTGQFDDDQEMNGDLSNQLDFYLVHSDPTPFNITAVVLKVEVSGT